MARPTSRFEPTKAKEKDGSKTDIPDFDLHLLCDEQGKYPAELKSWEQAVLTTEMKRDGFMFWYRNPDRPSQDSLGISYSEGDDSRIVRPDFIFFAEEDGEIVSDIVDPHGFHLADAMPKLKGLARYAETHSTIYRRIEAVAETGGKLRMLDLTQSKVRQAVMESTSAESLYKGAVACDYQ